MLSRVWDTTQALFGKHVDVKTLESALETREGQAITPKKFMRTINRICERDPQHIVLPEGTEPRILRAAAELSRKGLAHITLLGEKSHVEAEASRISVDISEVERHALTNGITPSEKLAPTGMEGTTKPPR